MILIYGGFSDGSFLMKLVINKVKKETGLKTFALDRKDNIIQLTNEIIKSFAEHEHD